MTLESDILYQNGNFWVCKAKKGYEVYEDGITHATRRAIIGSNGPQWFARAKEEADRRALTTTTERTHHMTSTFDPILHNTRMAVFNTGLGVSMPQADTIVEGVLKAVEHERLRAALERLLNCPDLNLDSLEPETIEAIKEAKASLGDIEIHPISKGQVNAK